MKRGAEDAMIAVVIIGVALALVGAIVWGVIALVGALSPPPGPGDTEVSWQCTEFGDRLYWSTGHLNHGGFAVVPGGCRS